MRGVEIWTQTVRDYQCGVCIIDVVKNSQGEAFVDLIT